MFPAAFSSSSKELPTQLFNRITSPQTANIETRYGKLKNFVRELFRPRGLNITTRRIDSPKLEPEKKSVKNVRGPINKRDACIACGRIFKSNDVKMTCSNCKYHVCSTCTKSSPLAEDKNSTKWNCGVCNKKKLLNPRPSKSCLDIPDIFLKKYSDSTFESTASLCVGPKTVHTKTLKTRYDSSKGDEKYNRICFGYLRANSLYVDSSPFKTFNKTWQENSSGSLNKLVNRDSGHNEAKFSKVYRKDLPTSIFAKRSSTVAVTDYPESSSQHKPEARSGLHLSLELFHLRPLQNELF